jgi:hypothetical protein
LPAKPTPHYFAHFIADGKEIESLSERSVAVLVSSTEIK